MTLILLNRIVSYIMFTYSWIYITIYIWFQIARRHFRIVLFFRFIKKRLWRFFFMIFWGFKEYWDYHRWSRLITISINVFLCISLKCGIVIRMWTREVGRALLPARWRYAELYCNLYYYIKLMWMFVNILFFIIKMFYNNLFIVFFLLSIYTTVLLNDFGEDQLVSPYINPVSYWLQKTDWEF